MPADAPPPRLRDPWSSDRRGASTEFKTGEGGEANPDTMEPPTEPPPEPPLLALESATTAAAAGGGRAAAIATAPRHSRAGRIPVGRPLLRRGHHRQTGNRERHGTGDEISLTSHNASEHVCRRTAEPLSTQQACQTGQPGIGLFFDSTPLAGRRPVLLRVQAVRSRLQALGSGLRQRASKALGSRLRQEPWSESKVFA